MARIPAIKHSYIHWHLLFLYLGPVEGGGISVILVFSKEVSTTLAAIVTVNVLTIGTISGI